MALAAARAHDWDRLEALEKQFRRQHPLQGYLDFHRLDASLPDARPSEVKAWQRRHADLPLGDTVERVALSRYGEAEDWQAIRQLRDSPPAHLSLQCHWWQAHYSQRRDEALAWASEVWLSGESRPASCDPLFDSARSAGVIDGDAIWERMQLAFRAGNMTLVRYLNSLPENPNQLAGEWLQRVYRQPQRVLGLPAQLTDSQAQAVTAAGLYRLAATDTSAALTLLENSQQHNLKISETGRAEVERRIAWYSTIRDLPENRRWLNNFVALKGHGELLEQRARRAIIEQRWSEVSAWVARMPVETQQSSRWQYWLGRAWQEQGVEDLSQEALKNAAGQRSFWGFLAAEQIQATPALNDILPQATAASPSHPTLERITLLRDANEPRLAMNEWRALIQQSDSEQRAAFTSYALQAGWYELSVEGALQTNNMDALGWRFPPAYQDRFFRAAEQIDADPWLMMAVARRESAFNPQAISPAGAMGLMQVMPATARQVSRWLGNGAPGPDALFDIDTSISLGGTYLAVLLERYQQNRLLALAAYNAGPHRVDSWLPEQEMPFDVWIESIPFRETRDYVQAVLIYRSLLATLNNNSNKPEPLLLAGERDTDYQLALRPQRAMESAAMELAKR